MSAKPLVAAVPGEWLPETPKPIDWRDGLRRYNTGAVIPQLANAVHALRCAPEWAGVLAFDLFALQMTARCPAPWHDRAGVQWSDHDDRKAAEWLQHAGINVGVELAGQAGQTAAMERAYHPVRDWLRSLEWDRTERLQNWLPLYCGSEQSEYARAVGARFLMAAVARILRPGAKVDTILVLEGPQGIGKSSAGRVLFEPYFCDHLPDLGSKDAFLQLRGIWCVELAELVTLSRAESSRIKAFLSSATDRYRPPYGKRAIDVPRQCVFLGTSNHYEYLKDETGNRRFWPVRCGTIRLRELERDRDQLIAEAVVRVDGGARWWLDSKELTRDAEQEQSARYDGDPWDQEIEHWLDGRESVSVEQVLKQCIGKNVEHWTQGDKIRVARALRASGWVRYREREGDRLEWRYRRQG